MVSQKASRLWPKPKMVPEPWVAVPCPLTCLTCHAYIPKGIWLETHSDPHTRPNPIRFLRRHRTGCPACGVEITIEERGVSLRGVEACKEEALKLVTVASKQENTRNMVTMQDLLVINKLQQALLRDRTKTNMMENTLADLEPRIITGRERAESKYAGVVAWLEDEGNWGSRKKMVGLSHESTSTPEAREAKRRKLY